MAKKKPSAALAKFNRIVKTLKREKGLSHKQAQKQAKAIYHGGRPAAKKSRPAAKKKSRPKKARTGSVNTVSKSHTDKNRINVDMQIGHLTAAQLASRLKLMYEADIGKKSVKVFTAKKAKTRNQARKELAEAKRKFNKLC